MSHIPSYPTDDVRDKILNDLLDTQQTIYVGIAGFTVLVWDHIVTSGDEIELIWKGPKGVLVYLFLLNRYLTPLGFIINLVAYTQTTWSMESCHHFVRYEGALTAIGIEIVGLMMLIRVWALYRDQRSAVALAAVILLAWIGVTAWLLSHGEPVPHSSNVHSCSMVFLRVESGLASASAWLPLMYDTYVFGLTLHRTFPSIRKEAGNVVRTLFADGLLYYSIICAVNLALTIMLVKAPEGVRNITAQLELLLTVTMMSRITLSLKKQGSLGPSPEHSQLDSIILSTRNAMTTGTRGVVVLGRLRSHSTSSARVSNTRMRSGSASSITPSVRSIAFAQNPSLAISRPHLSTIFSAINTPNMSPSGSPVSDRADCFSNKPSAANVV